MYILIVIWVFSAVLDNTESKEYPNIKSQTQPHVTITANSMDVDQLIYGGIPIFEDVVLPSAIDKTYRNVTKHLKKNDEINISIDSVPVLIGANFVPISYENMPQEVIEFNNLSNIVTNITRRFHGRWYGYTDPEDYPNDKENLKINKMDHVVLQFLIHSRYLIKQVLDQKQKFRYSFRYRIGYLFNRLRRLRYEQLKIMTAAENQYHTMDWQDLHSLVRFYEKIVRFDIDVKDTIKWIKQLHEKSEKIKKEELALIKKSKKEL